MNVHYTACPFCDEMVGGPGTGQHRKGASCRVRSGVKEMNRRGLYQADMAEPTPPTFLKELCEQLNIPAETAPAKAVNGEVYYATFLPEWGAAVWQNSAHLDYRGRVWLLERARDEEDVRYMIFAASKMDWVSDVITILSEGRREHAGTGSG